MQVKVVRKVPRGLTPKTLEYKNMLGRKQIYPRKLKKHKMVLLVEVVLLNAVNISKSAFLVVIN